MTTRPMMDILRDLLELNIARGYAGFPQGEARDAFRAREAELEREALEVEGREANSVAPLLTGYMLATIRGEREKIARLEAEVERLRALPMPHVYVAPDAEIPAVADEAGADAAGRIVDAIDAALEDLAAVERTADNAIASLGRARDLGAAFIPERTATIESASVWAWGAHKALVAKRDAVQSSVDAYYEAHPEPEVA